MSKSPNHRRVKQNRSYNVPEAAACVGVHKHTVRRWIAEGLPKVGGKGQTLILGHDLRRFLEGRRRSAKRPCPAGHLYCLKCRQHRLPAGMIADYVPITPTSGNLKALCPYCFTEMHRRVREADLGLFGADLQVTRTEWPRSLCGRTPPSLNSDSSQD
jgi:hypothetical protein